VNIPESPGDRLLDELSRRGWTQQRFAEIVGRPPQAISEIIGGKKRITPITALQFAAALGTPADVWLHLQAAYLTWQLERTSTLQAEMALIKQRALQASE
jgi:HTH-type transcriptional regulator/antitoxin HigA